MAKQKNEKLCNLIQIAQGERTQNQYALQCGVSSAALSRIFRGDYKPSSKTLKKISSHAYGGITYEMLLSAAGIIEDKNKNENIQQLTAAEQELLTAFRALNGTMQAYVLQIVKGAVSTQEKTATEHERKNKNVGA